MRTPMTFVLALVLAATATAQGGLEMGKMWTFENPPLEYLKKEHKFDATQKWLDSLRLASLRLTGGCSASFVSTKGLIMTNHHCVRDNINTVQGKNDWIKNGFYATSMDKEIRLPGLTVQQLISTKNVTDAVNESIIDEDSDAETAKKRKANRRKIEASAKVGHPDLVPQIITMHQGAVFQLYMYRNYSDVRLVCAPHLQTSHFGGDPDNFTYPRFGIDFSFCRAYGKNGKPADTSRFYFRWSKAGPKKGELAFVTGNPGSTGRLLTRGQMGYLRKAQYPMMVEQWTDELEIVKARAKKDPTYEKRVRTFLLQRENQQKAVTGYLNGLHNPSIQAAKDTAEAEFLRKVETNPKLKALYGKAWGELETINKRKTKLAPTLSFYVPSYSKELTRAVLMVQATDQGTPPKARDQAAKQARKPIVQSPTADKLFAAHLKRAKNWLGSDDAYVQMLLGNQLPTTAVAATKNSIVAQDAMVDKLLDGGREALEKSSDPLIRAALMFTAERQKAAKEMGGLNTREGVQGSLVGRALFAVFGNKVSPDATFSLRLSDGIVKGFRYNGTIAPYRTTFYGLYARNAEFDNKYPFNLPKIWLDRKDKIDMTKGVNFVATNDIIGGNSGSPIVNKDLEVIGLIFDGNIEMLGNRFLYKDDVPRSVSVHSQAIIEAMSKIYDAHRIVDEIAAGSK